MTTAPKLFCIGYGYTCDYLAHELSKQGLWSFAGTTRDPEKLEYLRADGLEAHLFDRAHPLVDPSHLMRNVTHILVTSPPDDAGDPAFLTHGTDLASLPNLQWLGYLSSTSVYGDKNGALVNEAAEINPTSKRGSRRAKAEEQWLSLHKSSGLPVHIFRLSGIYGPGRSALDSVRAGIAKRIEKPGHVFNRIHVEDIVQVLIASMAQHNPGQAYNVADDVPAPSHEVISHACKLLGRPEPPLIPFENADLAPMARSFYKDHKRIDNTRIKEELGVQLKYPSYREGLQACLDAEDFALSIFNGMG